MNSDNIGIKMDTRPRILRVWLFYKDGEYPFNYIGKGVSGVAKKLGINEQAAKDLLAEKFDELIAGTEDETVKTKLQKRLCVYRCVPPEWKKPRKCIGCSKSYIPYFRTQHYCSKLCHEQTKRKREEAHILRRLERKRQSRGVGNPKCPYCNGPSRRKGTRKYGSGLVQAYMCYDCGKTFQPTYMTKRGPNHD